MKIHASLIFICIYYQSRHFNHNFMRKSLLFYLVLIIIKINMSFADLDEIQEDSPKLPQKILEFNQKMQNCRFISHINQNVLSVVNGEEISKLSTLQLKKTVKSQKTRQNTFPTFGKFQSFNEKELQIENSPIKDAEVSINMIKNTLRKKITIQKKQSQDDPLQGQGVIKLKDGEVIFATWKNGIVVGQARIVYPSGNVYIGHGNGSYSFKNGIKYEGNFKNGRFQGYGELTDQFGQIINRGIWSRGQLIQNII